MMKNTLARTARALSSSSHSARKNALAVDDPYTGKTAFETGFQSLEELRATGEANRRAQVEWANSTSLDDRIALVKRALADMVAGNHGEALARSITSTMGKPLGQARNELKGMIVRANVMCELAPTALAEIAPPQSQAGFYRRIVHEPLGQVMILSPWNYPLLTAVNGLVPALLAGNSVLLSHGYRTPEVSLFFQRAFERAGAPRGLVSGICTSHETLHEAISKVRLADHVVFTGSVQGGHAVNKTLGALDDRFVRGTFELGGNDAMYVAADCFSVAGAAASVVDGAFYNAGQSCCGVQRVFVDESIHAEFLREAAKLVNSDYGMGDPLNDPKVGMGPLAQAAQPRFLEQDIVADALRKGAKLAAGTGKSCTDANGKGRFFSATLLDGCTPEMNVMKEEAFGPVMAVRSVRGGEEEAVKLMNASKFGLTAGIYSRDVLKGERMAKALRAGTVFMNRCDYLDPYLAFNGRGDSGNGLALSVLGFQQFTNVKSLHFKLFA